MKERTAPLRVVIALAVALVVAVVAVVVLWVGRDGESEPAAAGDSQGAAATSADDADLLAAGLDAQEAARAAVERMTTYSWRTVEDDFTWVDDAGTEQFRAYFAGAGRDAIAVIKSLKASATGTVVDSAPSVTDAEHVKVLLFVDQEITAAEQDGTKLDQPRVSMQMVLQDGAWLVDEVAVNDILNTG